MFSHSFPVRLSELDGDGQLQPFHLVSYFQDAASMYLHQFKMSGFDLAKQNLGWVINAMSVLFEAPLPGWNEPVELTTWALNRTGVRLFRDFVAKDRYGAILAKGTSSWVIIDETTRRPIPQERFNEKELIIGDPILPEIRAGRFSPISEEEISDQLSFSWLTRSSEQDLNRHINNIHYLIACIDSVPASFRNDKKLTRLDIVYKAEIFAQQEIEIRTILAKTAAEHRLIRTSDGQEVCVAKTEWKNRH